MSFTATESEDPRDVSVSRDNSRFELVFVVTADPGDTVDENDVLTFLINGGVAIVFNELPRSAIRVDNRINSLQYKATVTYELSTIEEDEAEEQPGATESFDTTGGTVHRTHGLEVASTVGNYPTELGAALNYDGEKVVGIDVISPAYRYTFTVKKLDSEVTDAFQQKLHELTSTVNSAPVKWFLQRDLLFRGAVGSKTRKNARDASGNPIEDEWEITYNFDGRLTEVSIKVGEHTVPEKAGWDYISAVYEDFDDTQTKTIIRKVKSVAVIQVFPESDFNELGINI